MDDILIEVQRNAGVVSSSTSYVAFSMAALAAACEVSTVGVCPPLATVLGGGAIAVGAASALASGIGAVATCARDLTSTICVNSIAQFTASSATVGLSGPLSAIERLVVEAVVSMSTSVSNGP